MSRVCTVHEVTIELDGVCVRCGATFGEHRPGDVAVRMQESVTAAAIASIRQHTKLALVDTLRIVAEHIGRLALGRDSMADVRRRAFIRGGYVARDRLSSHQRRSA